MSRAVAKDAWKGSEMLRLVVGAAGFGCGNLPYFAVALAEAGLDCRVRVHEPSGAGFMEIRGPGGEIIDPGPPHFNAALDRRAIAGETIGFEVSGPDAQAALPLIREAFAKGSEARLATLRDYLRLKREMPGMPPWDTGVERELAELEREGIEWT